MDRRLQQWLLDNDYGQIVRSEGLAGGSISESGRLFMDSGTTLFIKRNDDAADSMFQAEAEGLKSLARYTRLRVPRVLHVEDHFILMEDLGDGHRQPDFYAKLGRGLAQLHQSPQQCFGYTLNNFCGSTEQLNTQMDDGFRFFAECRLLPLSIRAYEEGFLPRELLKKLETVAANLQRWIPTQDPVQLHGDFWSGNAHCDEHDQPALIDPACYWGWPETDLAMTQLFGGFTADFYDSYAEEMTLDPQWRERTPLYNLYHLLNHVLLFGSSYLPPIASTCDYFVGTRRKT